MKTFYRFARTCKENLTRSSGADAEDPPTESNSVRCEVSSTSATRCDPLLGERAACSPLAPACSPLVVASVSLYIRVAWASMRLQCSLPSFSLLQEHAKTTRLQSCACSTTEPTRTASHVPWTVVVDSEGLGHQTHRAQLCHQPGSWQPRRDVLQSIYHFFN